MPWFWSVSRLSERRETRSTEWLAPSRRDDGAVSSVEDARTLLLCTAEALVRFCAPHLMHTVLTSTPREASLRLVKFKIVESSIDSRSGYVASMR